MLDWCAFEKSVTRTSVVTNVVNELETQINIYLTAQQKDRHEATWHAVDLTDTHAVFSLLQRTAEESGCSAQLLRALHMLLTIPSDQQVASAMWEHVLFVVGLAMRGESESSNDRYEYREDVAAIDPSIDPLLPDTSAFSAHPSLHLSSHRNKPLTVAELKSMMDGGGEGSEAAQARLASLTATTHRLQLEVAELKHTLTSTRATAAKAIKEAREDARIANVVANEEKTRREAEAKREKESPAPSPAPVPSVQVPTTTVAQAQAASHDIPLSPKSTTSLLPAAPTAPAPPPPVAPVAPPMAPPVAPPMVTIERDAWSGDNGA